MNSSRAEAFRPSHRRADVDPGERPLSHSEARLAKEYHDLAAVDKEPKLTEFSHISSEMARQDTEAVRRLRSSFVQAIGGERGLLMENFLEVEVDRSDWFGATTVRTTRFDDFFNGVDLVLEWEQEEGDGVIPRLAVDVTTARGGAVLRNKQSRADAPARVKYFRSDVTGKDLTIFAPEIILAVQPEIIEILAGEADKARVQKTGRGEYNEIVKTDTLPPKAFAEHPIQLLLLQQAREQLARLIALSDSDGAWDYAKLPQDFVARLQAFDTLPDEERSYKELADIFASLPGTETARALRQVRVDGRDAQNKKLEWKQRIAVYRRVAQKIRELELKMKNTPAYGRRVEEFQKAIRRLRS